MGWRPAALSEGQREAGQGAALCGHNPGGSPSSPRTCCAERGRLGGQCPTDAGIHALRNPESLGVSRAPFFCFGSDRRQARRVLFLRSRLCVQLNDTEVRIT